MSRNECGQSRLNSGVQVFHRVRLSIHYGPVFTFNASLDSILKGAIDIIKETTTVPQDSDIEKCLGGSNSPNTAL